MSKKLIKTESVDGIIAALEKQVHDINEKTARKIAEYDAKAAERKAVFLKSVIDPLNKASADLKTEIAKYQKIKNILG